MSLFDRVPPLAFLASLFGRADRALRGFKPFEQAGDELAHSGSLTPKRPLVHVTAARTAAIAYVEAAS